MITAQRSKARLGALAVAVGLVVAVPAPALAAETFATVSCNLSSSAGDVAWKAFGVDYPANINVEITETIRFDSADGHGGSTSFPEPYVRTTTSSGSWSGPTNYANYGKGSITFKVVVRRKSNGAFLGSHEDTCWNNNA